MNEIKIKEEIFKKCIKNLSSTKLMKYEENCINSYLEKLRKI